jgi:hypothetical protein
MKSAAFVIDTFSSSKETRSVTTTRGTRGIHDQYFLVRKPQIRHHGHRIAQDFEPRAVFKQLHVESHPITNVTVFVTTPANRDNTGLQR